MKRMMLSEEEVALVLNHRTKVASDKRETERIEKIRNCNHTWEFDFQNYKCYYYKCRKCGGKKVES